MWNTVKLTPSDGEAGDEFGTSVSLSGDVAIVGAPQDDDLGFFSGSAYVFRFNGTTWVEEQELTASDDTQGDYFGHSVSLSGDAALVGALYGTAYVFRFNGTSWVEEQKLTASDGGSSGESVSLGGDVAIVSGFGSAYAFRHDGTTWVEEQELTASDGAAGDLFGTSVSLGDGVAIVGAPWDDDLGSLSGSSYVFRFDGTTWVEEQRLTASDGAPFDYFGTSLSLSGDVAMVGAPYDDDGCLPIECSSCNSGAAYIFDLVLCQPVFTRGDGNGDGVVDIGDPVYNLAYLFGGGPTLCLDAQDANDVGAVDVGDPVYNLQYLFSSGPFPPAPFPSCGVDPTGDPIGCLAEPACP